MTIIVIEGGLIRDVYSDEIPDIVVIDHDDQTVNRFNTAPTALADTDVLMGTTMRYIEQ